MCICALISCICITDNAFETNVAIIFIDVLYIVLLLLVGLLNIIPIRYCKYQSPIFELG